MKDKDRKERIYSSLTSLLLAYQDAIKSKDKAAPAAPLPLVAPPVPRQSRFTN